jgi:hypothetical protein
MLYLVALGLLQGDGLAERWSLHRLGPTSNPDGACQSRPLKRSIASQINTSVTQS